MESEQIDHIQWCVRVFVRILLCLGGANALWTGVEPLWGFYWATAAMVGVGVAAAPAMARAVLLYRPKTFVALIAVCALITMLMVLTCPSSSFPLAPGCGDPFAEGVASHALRH